MLLRSLPRAVRADIRRMLWRWIKPKRSPAIIELDLKRARLRAAHRSTKTIDKAARQYTTARLRRDLGVQS